MFGHGCEARRFVVVHAKREERLPYMAVWSTWSSAWFTPLRRRRRPSCGRVGCSKTGQTGSKRTEILRQRAHRGGSVAR